MQKLRVLSWFELYTLREEKKRTFLDSQKLGLCGKGLKKKNRNVSLSLKIALFYCQLVNISLRYTFREMTRQKGLTTSSRNSNSVTSKDLLSKENK